MPKVTQKQLLDFAHLSKDFNPVHLDEVFVGTVVYVDVFPFCAGTQDQHGSCK